MTNSSIFLPLILRWTDCARPIGFLPTRPFALDLCYAVRYLLLQLERAREHQQASARLCNQINNNVTTEAGLLVEEEGGEENNLARVQSIEMGLIRG